MKQYDYDALEEKDDERRSVFHESYDEKLDRWREGGRILRQINRSYKGRTEPNRPRRIKQADVLAVALTCLITAGLCLYVIVKYC